MNTLAKKMKRLLSLIICVMMIASSLAVTSVTGATQFYDMPNNWSTEALTHAVSYDLLRGKGGGMLCPDDYLTRAEMATVINRAFNAEIAADITSYTDVSSFDWYYNEFGKALNMQTFYGTGDNMFRPENTITREEVFIAIARALVVSTTDYSVLDKFTDGSDVSGWAKEFVAALVSNGYVNGYGNGTILPKNNITRAEFAQLLYNIFKQYITAAGTYNDVVNYGGVVIRNEGISLSNVTINGDLVIADGVGKGVLVLENVKVNGRLLVRGSSQITVKSCEFTKGIVVKNVNGTVHFDNYRNETPFVNFTELTKATFKGDSYTIGFGGGSSGGSSGGSPIPAEQHDVVFNLGGGAIDPGVAGIINDVLKVYEGTTITPSMLPGESVVTKPNVTFGGWYNDAACTDPFVSDVVDGDLHLYAKWMAGITFVSVESSVAGTTVTEHGRDKIDLGTTVTPIANPTRDGYTFAGWYADEFLTTPFDFTAFVSVNTTIYAKWEINKYTVTFETGVGATTVAPVTNVAHGSTIQAPSHPSKAGYTFDKWVKIVNGSEVPFVFGTDLITADTTLYAKWKIKVFKVTFYTDDGEESYLENIEWNSTISAPVDPVKTGYTFGGWYKNSDYTVSFNFANDVIKEDTTLYARWTINVYNVVFDTDGGSVIADQNIEYNKKASKPYPDPSKDGHTFLGWYKDSACTAEYDFNTLITDDTTIYAKWEINTYLVTFESNGAAFIPSQEVKYEGYVTEPAQPSKDGYIFKGWYIDDQFITEFDFATPVIGGITLYAKWELKPVEYVTVTFVTNCANTIEPDDKVVKGSKISQPVVENQGYTLVGWYTTEDFKPETQIHFDTYTFNESITIYAKWDANPVYYTVKFYKGMTNVFLKGQQDYISGSLIPEGDIPQDAIRAPQTGFYKDETISPLYSGKEYTHMIDSSWFYKNDEDKWVEFDITKDIVQSDLELHNGTKFIEGEVYMDEFGTGFKVNTPYETDITDSYLTNVFKDTLFINRDNLNNAYNLQQLDEKKAELKSKLIEAGFIDANENILVQNIKLKFSKLIGEENLREFIVENAKKQLSSNDGLKDTLTSYIDSHSAREIESLIVNAINKQLENGDTHDETVEMIEELVLDVIENNPTMFSDMIEEYIETEIKEGRGEEVQTLIGEIITEGMTADTIKSIAYKVDMTSHINEYIDGLTVNQLKSYFDKIVNQFIDNENFKSYIDEYLGNVDDATLASYMKSYINATGEGKAFTDYLTDMTNADLANYISENLKDVMGDTSINAYITNYIDGLSEAQFKSYAELYIDSIDADTKEAYIKSYLNTLSAEELALKVADYVLQLNDKKAELNKYIGKVSDSDLAEYITDYVKENSDNADIIAYVIDYVKAEITSQNPNTVVLNKAIEFITDNADSIDEVKDVMKNVLPEFAKKISAGILTDKITEYFDTTEGKADFNRVLKKYLESLGYTADEIDFVLSNSEKIEEHKVEAIKYVVDEIKDDNSEVFEKDDQTGEFTNKWFNVDDVIDSFMADEEFIADMIDVDGVMDRIIDDDDVINTISANGQFKSQIMAMITDDQNADVLNNAVNTILGDADKKGNVVDKVITSILSSADPKAEIKTLVLKMIDKQGGTTSTVNDLASYLKDNLGNNSYALTGAIDYIYNNKSAEIGTIISHIKNPSIDTSVIVSKIASEIVSDTAKRAQIVDLIVTFITNPSNEGKKNEIIDNAVSKLVDDKDELSKYISSIFQEEDGVVNTKKSVFIEAIKNVMFSSEKAETVIKSDIKGFVNVIINSTNPFGKQTLINTYVDDIWSVPADKAAFIEDLASKFVTDALFRGEVMDTAIDTVINTPALKEKLVEKLLGFIEESDTHLEAVVKKVVEKMVGDGTSENPGDADLKDKMIDFIVEYLKKHPDDLDEIVDEVLTDDPEVDGELGDMLNEFVRQLIEEDKFTIYEGNKFIAEGMYLKLSEMADYTSLFEMVPDKVETLYKKIERFLPEDIIQTIYSRTINEYLTQLDNGIKAVTETTNGDAETFVTLTVNPVTELLNPLYDRAMDKAEMKLNNHFFYNENEYLQEIVDILTPSAMLDGSDSEATDILSGYRLREFDDYYFLLMRLSVLGDDTAQWYIDTYGEEKANQILDGIKSRIMKAFSYYNKLLAVVDEYTKEGTVPDRLDNEYVDKLIDILDAKFPFVDRLLNKFDDSKVDRPLKESDYDRFYQVLDLIFGNRTYVADDLFDSKYADKLDRFRVDDDTYQITRENLGTVTFKRGHK